MISIAEFIKLLEAILALIHRQRLPPPAAVKNLTVAVNRSTKMATATLKWTDPTTRTDGSALAPTDIAGVDIFDTAAPNPDILIGHVLGGVGTFTTDTLTVGDHAFTVVVTDTAGHKSAASNAVHIAVEATQAAPSPVADLSATLNA